jgi:hypothetical protein
VGLVPTFDERDKRFQLLVQRVAAAAESASNLKMHMWLGASTLLISAIGAVVVACCATQASHLSMTLFELERGLRTST